MHRNINPDVAGARARLAGLVSKNADPDRIETARADLATEKIADWIERQLAGAPPLSGDQMARIRAALPSPAGGDSDAT